jgi:porin
MLIAMPLHAQDQPQTGGQESTSLPSIDQRIEGTMQRQLGNVPDDVGYQLQESQARIDAIFRVGPLTPLHNLWSGATDHLRESIGLDLGFNYTALYQRADSTVRGPRDAASGDLDFFGRWQLTGCDDRWPGALVFDTETRHRYTDIPPARLNTGTVGGTVVSFGEQDFALFQMYWEHGSFDDGFIYRIGAMDPALIWDGGRYVSSNYAFLSPAFSDTLPMALPGAGIGVVAAAYPTDSTYVVAGVHDANGKRTAAGFNTFFGEGEYFSAVEFGWFPNDGEPNEGSYHVTLWHIDTRTMARRPNDRGIAVTLEQQVGCNGNLVPFLRYAYGHRGLNGIRQNLSVGLGIEEVLGQNFDLIGIAASWEEPANTTLRDQYIVEAFYRFHITPHTHLTPDIQVIIDPSNAPTQDAVTVFGLRLRTFF